ncbi:pyridoxamine 5'-phosphate oxidase family protein [Marinoscillum furvescens]|nr:pyridoxamine 5'-phosphate oxidase family protein [Marinoscillum furvescens]
MSLQDLLSQAWENIKSAAVDPSHPFRFLAFNTLGEVYPDTRMVVLRHFNPDANQLFVFTDRRSEKVKHIKIDDRVSLLFYDQERRVQVKCLAHATLLSMPDSVPYWKRLKSGKESYNTLHSPATVANSWEEAVALKPTFDAEDFGVIRCDLDELEVLQLQSSGHQRARFTFLGGSLDASEWLVP